MYVGYVSNNINATSYIKLAKQGSDRVVHRCMSDALGYFVGDGGAMNQIVHLWKFADDADRQRFWEGLFADEAFIAFANKLRPLIQGQENSSCSPPPGGPHPSSPSPAARGLRGNISNSFRPVRAPVTVGRGDAERLAGKGERPNSPKAAQPAGGPARLRAGRARV